MRFLPSFLLIAAWMCAAQNIDQRKSRSAFEQGVRAETAGAYDKAAEAFTVAIAANPKFAQAFRQRGKARLALGDPAKALEDLNRAVELAPEDGEAYRSRGDAHSRLERWGLAIKDYTRSLDLKLELASTYNARAAAHAR